MYYNMNMTTDEKQKMQEVMTLFYKLTHVVITLFDTNLEPIFDVGKWWDYCLEIGKDEKRLDKCRECNRKHAKDSEKYSEPYVYRCHAGIAEAVAPIRVDNSTVCYVMIGKFRDSDGYYSSEQSVIEASEHYGLDKDKMLAMWHQLVSLDKDQLTSAILLLQILIGYMRDEKLFQAISSSFKKQIEEYVKAHLSEKITIENICADLHFGYHELFALFKRDFKTTPHEYIDRVRFQCAKELLVNSSHSISYIASSLGFSKPSAFSTFFKVKMKAGITPIEYRKQHK